LNVRIITRDHTLSQDKSVQQAQAEQYQNKGIQDSFEQSLPGDTVQSVKQANDDPLELRLDDIVQDVKQLNPVQTDLKNTNSSVQNSKQIASIQDDDNTQPLPDNLVQDVKQALPAQIDDEGIDDSVYDSWIQLRSAIVVIMRLSVQVQQKRPHEVF